MLRTHLLTHKERKKYTYNYNVHRQKKWLCPKDGLQTNYCGNSKEGEVYVLLEWGESGEAFQRRKYVSWNQDLWAWKVEKASLAEATHERKHSDRKVQESTEKHRCCK